MANAAHVEILKQGVEAWNRWRKEHPEVQPALRGIDLSKEKLIGVNFSHTDLYEADLHEAILIDARLDNANLSRANLSCANLKRANLFRANLKEANLSFAQLYRAEFTKALLRGANLQKAELISATFYLASLDGVDLREAELGSTWFDNTDLSKVRNLNTCHHRVPSTIDHRTFAKSGYLPEEFLRGCGLPDLEIEHAKLYKPAISNEEITEITSRIYSLRANNTVQINPLFISYNHANAAFVDVLESRLIGKGIRFWRDVRHGTAGRLEKQVDRAMRLNPIVLLVLSRESVESDWVEHEAESARELEKELGRDVLCPVALDDAWKDCIWDRRLRRQIEKYNILDFSRWEEEEMFDQQFGRLIEGLDIFYK